MKDPHKEEKERKNPYLQRKHAAKKVAECNL